MCAEARRRAKVDKSTNQSDLNNVQIGESKAQISIGLAKTASRITRSVTVDSFVLSTVDSSDQYGDSDL
jgi:hypothetical protein